MKSIRRALEAHVVSHNAPLAKVVRKMDPIILLRNAHPTERAEFANLLANCGTISKDQAKEFDQPLRSNVLFGRQ